VTKGLVRHRDPERQIFEFRQAAQMANPIGGYSVTSNIKLTHVRQIHKMREIFVGDVPPVDPDVHHVVKCIVSEKRFVDGGFRLSRFGVLAGGGWRNWLAAFLRS
jgi:hypothetical protein